MTGSDVETTVEASIETNIPRSSPESASRTRLRLRGVVAEPSEEGGVAVMGVLREQERGIGDANG